MSASAEDHNPGGALALRFALRELRGGLRGFYVFLACIALGVAAISGVNAVALSITGGIVEEEHRLESISIRTNGHHQLGHQDPECARLAHRLTACKFRRLCKLF